MSLTVRAPRSNVRTTGSKAAQNQQVRESAISWVFLVGVVRRDDPSPPHNSKVAGSNPAPATLGHGVIAVM